MAATLACDLALLERWLAAWSRSRGLPAPVRSGNELTVEVGWPDQLRRHVFLDAGADLRARAAQIHAPHIYLKAAVDTDTLRQALPPRWSLDAPGYLMTCTGPMPAATLPAGYRIAWSGEHGVSVLRLLDEAGAIAATGRIVLEQGMAVFDRIDTAEPHRRRGLARVVMLMLDQLAIEAGVTDRLLIATTAGARLYTQLGWEHLAPWSTAVLRSAGY